MASFTKAERKKTPCKAALISPSGYGKTYSSLLLARGLVGDKGRIAFIDTENGSATLYDTLTDFDHCEIHPNESGQFNYQDFLKKIREAEQLGYDCVIVDSLTHLWQGIRDDKDNIDLKNPKSNSFTNWAQPTKNFNAVIQALLQSRMHVIVCMRSKMEYVLEVNDRGKQAPRRVGLAPIMRDGIEYEFTIVFEVLENHKSHASKDRTGMFINEGTFLITENTGRKIADWLATAKDMPPPPPAPQPVSTTEPPPSTPTPPPEPIHNPMWNGSAEFPPPEYDRQTEAENAKRLIEEGYFTMDEHKEAMKFYGVSKVGDLSEAAFESYVLGHVRLVKQIIDETTKRGIPRAKLNEFARLDNEHSFFVSSIETKKKILSLILEQTIPQQGN